RTTHAIPCPCDRQTRGVDSVDLSHAHADGRPVRSDQDRVGLHSTYGTPGELQLRQQLFVGGFARDQGPVGRVVPGCVDGVLGLHEQPTADLPALHPGPGPGGVLDHEQADVLLAGEDVDGLGGKAGGDDHLGEDLHDLLGQFPFDGTVGGDDTTECGDRVGGVCFAVCFGVVDSDGDTARVGVLDDGHARFGEVVGGAQRCISVHVIVVGHGFAVQLFGTGQTRRNLSGDRVQGRFLVGILAVAQDPLTLVAGTEVGGPTGLGGLLVGCVDTSEPGGDRGVVDSGVLESQTGQAFALFQGETALAHGAQRVVVMVGVDHDRNVGVVLGGGTHHGGTTDVDLFDAPGLGGTRGHCVAEGVEVD